MLTTLLAHVSESTTNGWDALCICVMLLSILGWFWIIGHYTKDD